MSTAMREELRAVGGRRMRVRVGGAGDPLVLCHGFLGSAENFDAWLPALLGRRTVVIPDLPGCGRSEALAGEHTSAALAAAIEPLLDALDIGSFDLGGLCLGAPVACALARRRPAAVRRLLLHTPLLSPSLVRRRFHAQVRLFTAPGIAAGVRWLASRRAVSDLYKRLMVEGPDIDAVAAQVNFDNQVRAHPRAMREWLRDGLRCDDTALVAGRGQPTLLVVAGDDRIVNAAGLERLTRGWPGVRLVVDGDAGHAWTEAAVGRQVAAIAEFLDAPPAPDGATSARRPPRARRPPLEQAGS